jgi:hypothetical protein
MGDVVVEDLRGVQMVKLKRLPAAYRGVAGPAIREQDDVAFIPSGDAARRYRREPIGWMVMGVAAAVVGFGPSVSGPPSFTGVYPALVYLCIAVAAYKAVSRWRATRREVPPFGLTMWDDALVAYTSAAWVTIVPRGAVTSVTVLASRGEAKVTVTARTRRGTDRPKALGWFTADADTLRAQLDAWLAG